MGRNGSKPQDMLSQWRGYGQDGRGICLTLDAGRLSRIVGNVPGLRINPVVYDPLLQQAFIDAILGQGLQAQRNGSKSALEATVAALVFATPLMKSEGFSEEREWRLIFMPPQDAPMPKFGFQARRDFLAPFVDLTELWNNVRPKLLDVPELSETLPRPLPTVTLPLVPVVELMIGPSGHQELSQKAFRKLLIQVGRSAVTISLSEIPYRSLS